MHDESPTRGRLVAAVRDLRGDGRGWVVLAIAVGWLAILGIRFVVPAVLPAIKAEFGVDNATAGAVVSVVWLTYAAMQFPAGILVDRLGERRLLTGSTLAAAVGVFGVVVVPGFLPFVLAMAVFGLGTGLFGPTRATAITRVFEEKDGAAFGAVLAAGSLGAAALPAVANLLTARFGWRAIFALIAPVFVVVAVGTWRVVPAHDGNGAPGPREVASAVAETVSRRHVALAVTALTLMLFAFQGLSAFVPTYLVAEKGLSAPVAGVLFALMFVSGAVAQSVAGPAADRFGHSRVLVATTALSVPPLLALPVVEGVVPLGVLTAAIGLRLGIAPVSNAYIVPALDEDVRGAAWGLIRTGFFVVGSTGSIFVGAFADRALFDAAFVVLAVLTAAASVAYLLLPARDAVV